MKVTVIHGAKHKGSTYHIAQTFVKNLNVNEEMIHEFFLPKDMDQFCIGCATCFMTDEKQCPHYNLLEPIIKAIDEADLLIFDSPVYVFHVTGQMKAFLDHFGYRWMVHRPNGAMFNKIALVISTAAGGGMKSTNKDIKDSLTFWGVGKVYTYGKAVAAINWNGVTDKNKIKIEKDMKRLSEKVSRTYQHVVPSLKVKLLFYAMRFAQKRFEINKLDKDYWLSNGWLEKTRPWKNHRNNTY